MVEPARIIVVDGILVLWDRALRERFDLKIFVDTAADIRLIRRLRRDVAERNRTPEFVIEQYLDNVRPVDERFIEPSKTPRRRDHPGGRPQPPGARGVARSRALGKSHSTTNERPGSALTHSA